MGRKIAKQCDGLPLTAVALGNFLCDELSQDYWNNVLIRDIWELVHYVVQPALQSSYNSLSAPLKQCFQYCSILLKKYILEKNVVVQLWIAKGLIESSADQEKVGEEYFDELVSRSLIHRQSIGNEEANFEMHSLLHDFATMVSSSYCTRSITEVPNSIENLLYLRYLNLSHTKIERLPSATCKLYNLQFLLLEGCRRLIELPEDMGKLVNLDHLDISDTALREMPVQISKLENLHTLSDFVVSKHNDGLKLAELGKFPHLHGKEQIEDLALEWDRGTTFPDSPIQSVVLERLQPSTNLKSLTLKGYGGFSFPNWLGDFLLSNMVYLRISNCDDCLWLPPLGQLGNLKKLIIEGMQSVETIGTEFNGSDGSLSFQPFPCLETLYFENMQEWEEWNLIGGRLRSSLV